MVEYPLASTRLEKRVAMVSSSNHTQTVVSGGGSSPIGMLDVGKALLATPFNHLELVLPHAKRKLAICITGGESRRPANYSSFLS